MNVWTAYYLLVISNFIIATTVVGAATHQITWEAGYDCATWASNQKFAVGDKLIFFSNNTGEGNNVMNVSHVDYNTCNPSSPYATFWTGNDLVTINRNDLYFISSVREDCRTGLKLHVHTLPASTASHRAFSSVTSSRVFSTVLYTSVIYVLCLI